MKELTVITAVLFITATIAYGAGHGSAELIKSLEERFQRAGITFEEMHHCVTEDNIALCWSINTSFGVTVVNTIPAARICAWKDIDADLEQDNFIGGFLNYSSKRENLPQIDWYGCFR